MTLAGNTISLHDAAFNSHLEEVEAFIATGADTNASTGDEDDQGTALHTATVQGHLEVVKLLLSHGADPNARRGRFANQ